MAGDGSEYFAGGYFAAKFWHENYWYDQGAGPAPPDITDPSMAGRMVPSEPDVPSVGREGG
jgi:hypothetical protein